MFVKIGSFPVLENPSLIKNPTFLFSRDDASLWACDHSYFFSEFPSLNIHLFKAHVSETQHVKWWKQVHLQLKRMCFSKNQLGSWIICPNHSGKHSQTSQTYNQEEFQIYQGNHFISLGEVRKIIDFKRANW